MKANGIAFLVLMTVFLVIMGLIAYAIFTQDHPKVVRESFPESRSSEITDVDWVEINPPPGIDGPCYVFFHSESIYHTGYGFSGTYCK